LARQLLPPNSFFLPPLCVPVVTRMLDVLRCLSGRRPTMAMAAPRRRRQSHASVGSRVHAEVGVCGHHPSFPREARDLRNC
jgi:hypothetical protein